MHELYNHLCSQLADDLSKRRIVVWYDARSEFGSFLEELRSSPAPAACTLEDVAIAGLATQLCEYRGSCFEVRAVVGQAVAGDTPKPLLIYLPGTQRDRQGSVLMELEKAGCCYEPQLRRLARNLLRKRYTDGDIDEMLAPESLTYGDVVRFLGQEGDEGTTSLVKLVLGSGSSETLLTRWLASDEHDVELESKRAAPELRRMIQSRLGLAIKADSTFAKTRHQTLRYVLVNEFRGDLTCPPPDCLVLIPDPPAKENQQRICDVAEGLRRKHGASYIAQADSIEQELSLRDANLDAAALGGVDTFRFEEQVLLNHAARLVADADYAAALKVVADREPSFWLDSTQFLDRLAQWEACRLMAELGLAVAEVKPQVKGTGMAPEKWVDAYARGGGWACVDRSQRALESWVARMEDDPEEPLEKALGLVRRLHEELLEDMTQGYSKALMDSGWAVRGVLHQTQVFPECVETAGGRVAYFVVDAMRYEMGADLVTQLEVAEDVRIQPAVTALPSITSIGMAALLPGASGGFSVVSHKNKLAGQIGDSILPGLAERTKYVKGVRPDACDMDLGALLQKSTSAIEKKIKDAGLVIVRSQSIDGLGEMDGGLLARQIMDTVVGNLARAVRKLSKVGIEYFVITADHGHQFSVRKDEDMMLDKPGGDTVDQHRRCWAGHGGQTTAATVRVSGAELGYGTDLDFIFPKGLAVFRAGGDLAFHHGGISLQEMVTPVVTLRMPSFEADSPTSASVAIEGCPEVLTNRTFGFRLIHTPDLFSQVTIPARVILVANGQEAGRAGMAPGAKFDSKKSVVHLPPNREVSIGMILTRDDLEKVRIVVQDPETDAVLAQSDEITVGDLI